MYVTLLGISMNFEETTVCVMLVLLRTAFTKGPIPANC
jgi:hypothetical protein